MLRPGKLTKVRIVVLNAAIKQVIADLHTSGLLHLTKSKYSGLSEGRPLAVFEDLSENFYLYYKKFSEDGVEDSETKRARFKYYKGEEMV
jgi:vacuolar-type H+-ATPase subunit I/STV1